MRNTRKRARASSNPDIQESLPNLSDEGFTHKKATVESRRVSDARLSLKAGTLQEFISTHGRSLSRLYSDSAEAKIWAVASKGLETSEPPLLYPEYTKPGGTHYVYRSLDFWTSGFFPGSLYLLLERRRRYPETSLAAAANRQTLHVLQLEFACMWWTDKLHQNCTLKGTHDLGFMISPWARPAWELNRDSRAFESLKAAAQTLVARFDTIVGCIRSWDTCVTKTYNFTDPSQDFLMIIDNMMNLSMLFYVSAATGDQNMYEAALQHARTTQRTHIRPDFSTTHLVVFDPSTGHIKNKFTNQGYSHTSCWSRGQAWAIAGFAETYRWTLERSFLETATGCADYFLRHLPESKIPPWDFDAPGDSQPPDTSAAMIAAYGMLLLHQSLTALGEESVYLISALQMVNGVCCEHLNPCAKYLLQPQTWDTVERGTLEDDTQTLRIDINGGNTILNGATINNYEFAPRRWANHGLVYADYFFLLVGNKLLEMGVGGLIIRDTSS